MVKAVTHHEDSHDVQLAGAWPVRGDGAPSIVERTDEEFIPALLEELLGENPSAIVPGHRPKTGPDGMLQLFQPVHRTFNLALLEAHCATFGDPRLDARKIDSSGLVVRRVRRLANGARRYDAWCANKHKVAGWVELPDVNDPDHLRDPDPARRPQLRFTGDPAFDRQQFGHGNITAEETTSLFVAPPETAAATTRTLLYGMIPVTSSSRAGAMPRGDEASTSNWSDHVSILLHPAVSTRALWPGGNDEERAATLSRDDLGKPAILNPNGTIHTDRTRFVLLVRQLAQEFGILRPASVATRDALIAKLNAIHLTLVDGSTTPAGTYLHKAARIYFEQPEPNLSARRPKTWPTVSSTASNEIIGKLRQIAGELELAAFATDKIGGRFDDPRARYTVRAFIRVRRGGGCPPKIVWSPYSEEFRIVPWHESGPVAPTPVALPDPFDPNFLNSAKPNVSFTVPESLANFLNQDPLSFLKGEAKKKTGGFALDWICGFSIPIITICAFIVLNIFLSLFAMIFFWLPFVKICIPFPRPK